VCPELLNKQDMSSPPLNYATSGSVVSTDLDSPTKTLKVDNLLELSNESQPSALLPRQRYEASSQISAELPSALYDASVDRVARRWLRDFCADG
jgi:hypothetical protein